mgnify:CR=1 FL=1
MTHQFAGKQVIINAKESWGKMIYSISINGRCQISQDKTAWEIAVAQLREAGAVIIDNAAIEAEREAAKAAMLAKMMEARKAK